MFILLVNGQPAFKTNNKELSKQAYNSLFNTHREEGYDTGLSLPSAGLVHKKAVEHGSMTVKLSKPKRDDVNLTLLYIS